MGIIILLIILLIAAGVAPVHGYSSSYGWYPVSGLGLLFMVILVLILLGAIPHGVGTHPNYW